jgi:hypothetical protein
MQSSRLTNIGYSMRDTVSRVTFSVEGKISYVLMQSADTLVIRCAGMKAEKPLQELNRSIEAGLIRSVSVATRPDDMLDIIVGLRRPAPFRMKHVESSNSLALEVLGRAPTAVSNVSSPKEKSLPGKKEIARQSPKHVSREAGSPPTRQSVVDIAAIARAQVDPEKGSVPPMTGSTQKHAGAHPLTSGLILAALAAWPLATIAAILILKNQQKRSRRQAEVAPARVPDAVLRSLEPVAVMPIDLSPSMPEAVAEEPVLVPEEVKPDEGLADYDHSFQIAQSLIQGNEQYALAKRFATESSELNRKRIRKACAAKTARTHRVRVAKRLGVGKGEVELAIKLRDMAGRRPRKEKRS